MFNFEKLEVWQEAVALADLMYAVTRAFPDEERFGLSAQMRRAAVSVSSNIAEGSSRASRQDFARFLEIAAGSVFEVVSQAVVAERQKLLASTDRARVYAAADKVGRMLSGLRKAITTG